MLSRRRELDDILMRRDATAPISIYATIDSEASPVGLNEYVARLVARPFPF